MSALQDAFLIRYSPKLLDICLRAASDINDNSSFSAYPDIMLIWRCLSVWTDTNAGISHSLDTLLVCWRTERVWS